MAKDKKAKAAQKKARVAAKTEKKALAKDKKSKSRPKKPSDDGSSSDSDVDLDSILASYKQAQEAHSKITESALAAPPPPVSSATLIANPTPGRGAGEVFLFGGERIEPSTGLARFSSGLTVYRPGSDTWRSVGSPNSPLPRSGHAWCRGPREMVYLFGGEFSSPKQGTFHHYSDFWALEGRGREWIRLESKGPGPSARSGHRMVGWRRWVVLFGGFQDMGRGGTRYLGDLWVYDTQMYRWTEVKLAGAAQKPDPRSSFSFLPTETGAVVVGGYSRVKVAGGKVKGQKEGQIKPMVHTDCWALRMTEASGEGETPGARWERRKRPVNYPQPARAGATMAFHKGRGILFGGVHDVEDSDEGIESEFFNQLWAYNIERNRFFPLALRRPKQAGLNAQGQKRAAGAAAGGRRGRGKADEEELLKNLALIEEKSGMGGAGTGEDEAVPSEKTVAGEADESDDEEPTAVEKPRAWEMPHPRFNAQLAVMDDTLYIYGGTYEKGDKEFTFDELLSIDLGKLDGVKELYRREIEDWDAAAQDSSSDEDEDEEDEDEEDDESGNDTERESTPVSREKTSSRREKNENSTKPEKPDDAAEQVTTPGPAAEHDEPADEPTATPSAANDGLPFPQPFETLRAFYARTTLEWQERALKRLSTNTSMFATEERSAKEIKTLAFEDAERRWWDVREEVQAREDEMEEGGIGEVVSLGDRAAAGEGRRR